ncbi:MAG: MerR family transcriptional regulator [Clostridiaceae bacterium]
MNYTIKKFASMQGLTVDTLRQYEKKGIIRPFHDEENGYRYYTDMDVRIVATSRWFSSLGFTLSQVAEIMKNLSNKELQDAFSMRVVEQKRQIAFENEKLQELLRFQKYYELIEKEELFYEEVTLPELIFLPHSHKDTLMQDEDVLPYVRAWMELLPITFYTRRIPLASIEGEEPFSYYMALCISEENSKLWTLPMPSFAQSSPPRKCIHTILRKNHEEVLSLKHLEKPMQYLKERNLVLSGDVVTMYISSRIEEGRKVNYHYAYFPIER